jgi:hypothetical protein
MSRTTTVLQASSAIDFTQEVCSENYLSTPMEYCFLNDGSTYCLPTDTDSNAGSSSSICLPAPVMYAYPSGCISPYGTSSYYRFDSNSNLGVGSFIGSSDSLCSFSSYSYRLPYSECMGCNRFKDLANNYNGSNAGLAAGVIVGIVFAVLCSCCCCIFMCLFCCVPSFALAVRGCLGRKPPPPPVPYVVATPPPNSNVSYGQPVYAQPAQPMYGQSAQPPYQQQQPGYPQYQQQQGAYPPAQAQGAYSPSYAPSYTAPPVALPSAPPVYEQPSTVVSLVSASLPPALAPPLTTDKGADLCPSPNGCEARSDPDGSQGQRPTGWSPLIGWPLTLTPPLPVLHRFKCSCPQMSFLGTSSRSKGSPVDRDITD